jgi:CubicO group peptidase (beta-lactamase class C family)
MIEGTCDVRFAGVREAFAANFSQHAEIGAAVAVYAGGRVVVDLWGGFSDAARTRPWRERTLVDVFSVGRGIAALIVLDAVSRAELELDAAIARYWPEFGAAGKGSITLRQVLAHRAGVPAIREALPRLLRSGGGHRLPAM